MQNVILKENERIDKLHVAEYKIIQDTKRFCFGIDAVLISDYARKGIGNKKIDSIVDLGTGTGIIPFLMASCTTASNITGIEIQKDSADMASRSVILNSLEKRVHILNADIKDTDKILPGFKTDIVISNPPYMIADHGVKNDITYKTIARHEILCNLDDIVKAAFHLLKPNGSFYMIHRPFRLPEIWEVLKKYKFEMKKMQLVQPSIDKEANMVLIEAKKDAKARLTVDKTLIVYESKGEYSPEIKKIYGRE
ncbi:MAG: tRNA1(Val) (adenine(37)-N6)-methyltransferase [Treponema sp.]|nr:tRNA1(Val) (adenine(37)-N6)-methyltransferase [Treponema sp.]